MRKSNLKTFELVNFNNNNYSDVINLPNIIKFSLFKTTMMRFRTQITLWRHDRVPGTGLFFALRSLHNYTKASIYNLRATSSWICRKCLVTILTEAHKYHWKGSKDLPNVYILCLTYHIQSVLQL